jgi:hypothetical protein
MAACGVLSHTAHAQDTLFFEDGKTRVGKIVSLDPKSFRLEVMLAGSANGAPVFASVTIPRGGVVQIEFGPDEARERKLKEANDLTAIAALWKQWEPFLGVPKSPAGRIGTTYGNMLLQTGTPGNARAALGLFTRIRRGLRTRGCWPNRDASAR